MKNIKIEIVVKDLRDIFELNTKHNSGSFEFENKFQIDKQQFPRLEVLSKLQDYFKDKIIDGGYLKVDGITFVLTTFEVLKGKP